MTTDPGKRAALDDVARIFVEAARRRATRERQERQPIRGNGKRGAGRIVDHPMVTWVGEGSKREVIAPVTDPARAWDLVVQSGLAAEWARMSTPSADGSASIPAPLPASRASGGGDVYIESIVLPNMDPDRLLETLRDLMRIHGGALPVEVRTARRVV
jgi:hypothetical protein